MKRILILSDTHGLLREEVKARLAEADVVIHAGDINTLAVAEALGEHKESYVVRGNNDKEWAEFLPLSLAFTIEGLRFFLVHNKRDVPVDLPDVDVIVYGHSHQYSLEERGGVLWLNPGSCGKRRFKQEITFCWMDIEGRDYQIEKTILPQ